MGKSLSAIFAILIVATPAAAVNWEGHEDFFLEVVPVPALTEGIAPPLLAPMPSCETRRKRRETNSYEQEAIVGVNCTEQSPKTVN